MGKSFQGEHLSKVQRTAHESEAADLGREIKKLLNIIKMRIRKMNLLKGAERPQKS